MSRTRRRLRRPPRCPFGASFSSCVNSTFGVPGACTVHANSAAEALDKLCLLPLLAGRNIDRDFVAPAIASSVDLVVHCTRDAAGRRYVEEIVAPTGEVIEGRVLSTPVFGAGRPRGRSAPAGSEVLA